jgi:hypothetical protein
MSAPLDGPIQPSGDDAHPQHKLDATAKIRAANAQLRAVMKDGLVRFPEHNGFMADLLVQLDEIDACLDRREFEKAHEKMETLMLDMNARTQDAISGVSARMVEFIDKVEVRAEERKWEMPQEARDDLEEMLAPCRERFREEMLGSMPIEQRRALEEKARRLREGGGE